MIRPFMAGSFSIIYPAEVARLMYLGLLCFIPWPAAIGFRRFYQGIIIRNNRTRRVAYGTVIRLLGMALTALLLTEYSRLDGVVVGAISLSSGVVWEALASRFMAHSFIKSYQGEDPEEQAAYLSYRAIIKFYFPLALTSVIGMAISPMTTFFVGRSRMPLESLAVLPVIDSSVFLFRSFGFSYQEAVIALLGENSRNYRQLRNFAIMLAALTVSGLGLVLFTPLNTVWFTHVSGLSASLAGFAILPAQLMVVLPGFSVIFSLQRGVLVNARMTNWITFSTLVELICIFAVLFLSLRFFNPVGAVAVAIALLVGRILANLYLFIPFSIALRRAGWGGFLSRFSKRTEQP